MITEQSNVTTSAVAKLIGGLFLLQMFAGIWLNFFFYKPLFADPVQLNDDKIQLMIGVGVLLAIILSAINFTACLLTRPLLNKRFHSHFTCALSFTAIALCLTAMEGNQLSEFAAWIVYANNIEADALPLLSEPALFNDHVRQILATGRNKTHFMAILVSSFSLFVFYSLILRARLLPAPLMYFALAACALQLIAVGHALFSQPIPVLLQLPLAVNQLVLPIYLLFKGFNLEQKEIKGASA